MGNAIVEKRLQLWVIALALILGLVHYAQYWPSKVDIDSKLDSVVVVRTPTGQGTGFFFNDSGCIMTAFHVVSHNGKAEKVTVTLRGDGRTYKAKVVSGNSDLDMAVICSTEAWRPGLRIIETEKLKQGERVWALGNPRGRLWNVTDGVVSRFGYRMHSRPHVVTLPGIGIGDVHIAGIIVNSLVWIPRYDLIISAFISWGNSGGPVLNENGDVVGMIVEWEDVGTGHPANMNVAVPGTDLLRFIRSIWGKS
jgi:S1-C subfamily serine protease